MAFTAAPLPSLGLVLDTGKSDPGLFSLTRSDNPAVQATRLLFGRRVSGDYGELTLTGQDATLTESTVTVHAAAPLPMLGLLTLTSSGQYVVVGESGTFAATGQAAAVSKGRGMTGDAGAFVVSGAPAERDTELNGDVRLFQTLGQDAGLSLVRKLSCDVGAFALNGQESTGVVQLTAGDKVMPANVGAFVLNRPRSDGLDGGKISFVRGYLFTMDAGTFAVEGQAAHLDGPVWQDVTPTSGTWVYVTPSGGVWTDVDPDS